MYSGGHIHQPAFSPSPPKTVSVDYKHLRFALRRRCPQSMPAVRSLGFPVPRDSIISPGWSSRLLSVRSNASHNLSDALVPDGSGDYVHDTDQYLSCESPSTTSIQERRKRKVLKPKESSFLKILLGANSFLPHTILASTILAATYPPAFTWFSNRYYVPALGFLMFAVGVNSNEKDFLEAFKRPAPIFAGYVGQCIVKPLFGYFFGTIAITMFGLPTSLGVGIMLISCVSGAQLSNYATFLTDPPLAPLSIVMTSLSTATAVFVTPMLSLLLFGKRLPVDAKGMVSSILQIVVTPIVTGLLLNRLLPQFCNAIRPLLPPLSLIVTALCIGAPLSVNINSVLSPSGLSVLLLVIAFHLSGFIAGYFLTGVTFRDAPDLKALQRTLSFETGMQSSLFATALANKFFQDPLVSLPPAISVATMSLLGFALVTLWAKKEETVK